jgi:hypothetical protein
VSFEPDFGRTVSFEHADELLVEMTLRRDGAAGRNLHHVHAGKALHAGQIDERAGRAGELPGLALDHARIVDAVAAMDRDILSRHPLLVSGLLDSPRGLR